MYILRNQGFASFSTGPKGIPDNQSAVPSAREPDGLVVFFGCQNWEVDQREIRYALEIPPFQDASQHQDSLCFNRESL